VTAAAQRGATLDEIMNTTRHRSAEQVIGYIRRETPFDRNASRGMLSEDTHVLMCGRGHVHEKVGREGTYCLRDECAAGRGAQDPVRRIEWRLRGERKI
jgi:hypothetical protein